MFYQILIYHPKRPLLYRMDSHIINHDADGEDSQYCKQCIETSIRHIISICIMQHIFPKPLAHRVTIGMYQQHTEGACSNRVDPLMMSHLQVLEEHKGSHGGQHCQQRVGIRHIAISPMGLSDA